MACGNHIDEICSEKGHELKKKILCIQYAVCIGFQHGEDKKLCFGILDQANNILTSRKWRK